MQDPNGWYSRQRSNAGRHLYPMQEPASGTSARAPDSVHGAQTLCRDPFTSATSTTHGEVSSPGPSLVLNLHFSDPSSHPSIYRRIYAPCAAPLLQC